MSWIGTFRRVPWGTAPSKFQVLPAAAHWLIMSPAPNLSEDASEAAGDLSKSHSPLVLPLRNSLLPWLPASLRHVLQRVKRGVSPSRPVRHNLLVRPLKTFSSLVKRYRRKNSLFTALVASAGGDCFCSAWEGNHYHTQHQETGWNHEDGSAEKRKTWYMTVLHSRYPPEAPRVWTSCYVW